MYNLIIHQDFFEKLNELETSSPQLARKIHSKLVELQLYGWCNYKSTKHQKIAWKRAILSKSKYYLMWKDENKDDFNRDTKNGIIIRMIANHDDTSDYDTLYPLGSLNDYDTHYKASFMLNEKQKQVTDEQGKVQLIFSSPGTGKTISLLKIIEGSDKKFLFLSESKMLIKKASKYLERNSKNSISLTTEQFYKELLSLDQDKKYISFLECKENFIKDITKAKIADSNDEATDIFNHLYAFAMGSTIPYAAKKLFFDTEETPIHKRLIFDSIARETRKNTYLDQNKIGKKLTKAIEYIFNSKDSRAEFYFPRQTNCYQIIRDHLIDYDPKIDDCSIKKNGRRVNSLAKRNDIAILKTPDKFSDIDGIIIDEAQDLSPIELSAILIFAHAISEASGKQDSFSIYFAGDRGQSIFPTGFDVNLLKSTISKFFSKDNITEHKLETNLRNTAQITAVIDNINNFYKLLSKEQRKDIKTLQTYTESEKSEHQIEQTSLYYTKFNSQAEYTQFYEWMTDSRNKLNYFNCHIINYQNDEFHKKLIKESKSDIIEDTYTFKGLDTDIAIVPNPISLVNTIHEFSKRNIVDEIDDFRIKYAINNFKVAISRATEIVIFAQIDDISAEQYQIFLEQIIPNNVKLVKATPTHIQEIIIEKFEEIDFESGIIKYLGDIETRSEQEEYQSAIQITYLLLHKMLDYFTQSSTPITEDIKNKTTSIVTKLLNETIFSGKTELRQEAINCWNTLQLINPMLSNSYYTTTYLLEYTTGDFEKILKISEVIPTSFLDFQIKNQLRNKYVSKEFLKTNWGNLYRDSNKLSTYIKIASQLTESSEREITTNMIFNEIMESALRSSDQELKMNKPKAIKLLDSVIAYSATAHLLNIKTQLCQQIIKRTLESHKLTVSNEEMASYISFLKQRIPHWSLSKEQCRTLSLLSSHNAPVIQFNQFLIQNEIKEPTITESIASNPLLAILFELITSGENISEAA